MSASNDRLRTELDRKFQPPIDVLLDPSLFVANRSLEQLSDSTIFASQTQATLDRTPTEPRLGDLFAPATFHDLISSEDWSTMQKTDIWEFYRGQAEPAFPGHVVDLLDKNDVNAFTVQTTPTILRRTNPIDDPDQHERVLAILEEEFSFLQSGGFVLSRTSAAFDAFRDAGVLTIDIGKADLTPELQESLTDIGYQNPADICGFGISSAGATADALAGDIFTHNSDTILYRLGE